MAGRKDAHCRGLWRRASDAPFAARRRRRRCVPGTACHRLFSSSLLINSSLEQRHVIACPLFSGQRVTAQRVACGVRALACRRASSAPSPSPTASSAPISYGILCAVAYAFSGPYINTIGGAGRVRALTWSGTGAGPVRVSTWEGGGLGDLVDLLADELLVLVEELRLLRVDLQPHTHTHTTHTPHRHAPPPPPPLPRTSGVRARSKEPRRLRARRRRRQQQRARERKRARAGGCN